MPTRQKTTVISDVHMSNGKPYTWFHGPNSENLTNMLNFIANDSSVGELVLLGDLFDLWLYPVEEIPWTVEQIIEANPSVTKALQQCVEKIPNVYYMNGNHDMAVVPDDLKLLNSGHNNIQCIITENYRKQHRSRHLEHGHLVDMFNSPDDSGDTIGGYPLGYFITRLVATAANQSEVWRELRKLYKMFRQIHKAIVSPEMAAPSKVFAPEAFALPSVGPFLVQAIITLLEKLAQVNDDTPIRFSEVQLDNKYTVGDIKGKYGTLYHRWHAHYHGDRLLDVMLATKGLEWHAYDLISSDSELKVVVMGHTHASVSGAQYDNDGCWCIPDSLGHGDANPTYVEIVGDTATLVPWGG